MSDELIGGEMFERLTVSVVIPTYNRAHTLVRAVQSVLDQSYSPLEVLVVDDGSDDDTRERIEMIGRKDDRVRYLRQNRAGAPAARNLGIQAAAGELVAFQDSDDEWHPEFLESLVRVHDNRGTIAFSSFRFITRDGQSVVFPEDAIDDVRVTLRKGNVISTQTAVVCRTLFEHAHFDERLKRLQDWDLWLALASRARFSHVAAPLVTLHRQEDSLSANAGAGYSAHRIIVRKHWRELSRSPMVFAWHVLRAAWARPFRGRVDPRSPANARPEVHGSRGR